MSCKKGTFYLSQVCQLKAEIEQLNASNPRLYKIIVYFIDNCNSLDAFTMDFSNKKSGNVGF